MKNILLLVLLFLSGAVYCQTATVPQGFINWLGNKTIQKSGIYTEGLTIPHGSKDTLYSHPPKDGSIFWNTVTHKLGVYDSASHSFIVAQGDSVTVTNGTLSLYKTLYVNTRSNIVPVYTFGYTVVAANTTTPSGTGILNANTVGDTTYVRYSSPPPRDTIRYVFAVSGSVVNGQSQSQQATVVYSEYLAYATTNYTVDYNNGTVQNIVFDITAPVTLTLPTPTTNMTLHIANMSAFAVTTSLNLYSTDASAATTITNRRLEAVWSQSRQKWYVVQD